MFSPERFGTQRKSFGTLEDDISRHFVGLKTAFRGTPYKPSGARRNPLQNAAHFRFSEPTTPAVLNDRGLRPSDLSDPHKKDFLTNLTSRVFHLALEGVDEASRDRIPLERLFTPATDSAGDLTPKKRKIYGSSCFYRPDHPTIEDQVDLAHKISVSLIDEENKQSKGHNMYMKRKNRSSKWIHAGEYVTEEDLLPPKESKQRPPLKLLMNPKGLHDYTSIQQGYEDLSNDAQMTHSLNNIEGPKEIATDLQSPTTGKGAALFAKRKKRMDKFIVDENTIQKQATVSQTTTQESSYRSSYQEETQTITNSLPIHPPEIETASAGSLILPDITKILTQQKSAADKKPLTKAKTKSSAKKEYSWNISTKKEVKAASSSPSSKRTNSFHISSSTSSTYDPTPVDLRPGTPPMYVVSDKQGNLLDKTAHFKNTSDGTKEEVESHDSEGGAIYTAEVKLVQTPTILQPTPLVEAPTPQQISLDRLTSDSIEDKRKSFNIAAKGWGTYSDFYTPLHVSTS